MAGKSCCGISCVSAVSKMQIEIDGWVMEADAAYTQNYSDKELSENCQCAYCRNYYAAVDIHYSELRGFLEKFGVQIHAPEEMLPYEMDEGFLYDPKFSVAGRILCRGNRPIRVAGLSVTPTQDELAQARMDTAAFSLHVDGIHLPWVLSEPFPGKRRRNNLFRRFCKSNIGS